jgi:hypothetical protein
LVLDVAAGTVEVLVEHRGKASCPKCDKPCAGYDARRRRWRHRGLMRDEIEGIMARAVGRGLARRATGR